MIASALRFTMLFLAATAACCGCPGAVHMEWTRQELPAVRAKGGDAAEMALPPECHEFILEGQLGFGGNHMGGGLDRQGWRVEMLDCDGHPLRRISATYGTAPLYDGFSDSRYLRVEIDSVSPDGSAVPLEKNELHDEKRLYGRTNTLTVDNTGGRLRVWLGKEGGIYVAGGDGIAGVSSLRFSGTRDVSVKNAMIKWRKDPAGHLRTAWNAADIQAAYAATQEGTPTGNWKFLDRDTDAKRIREFVMLAADNQYRAVGERNNTGRHGILEESLQGAETARPHHNQIRFVALSLCRNSLIGNPDQHGFRNLEARAFQSPAGA